MKEFFICARKGDERPVGRIHHHHMTVEAARREAARLALRTRAPIRVFKVIGQVKADGRYRPVSKVQTAWFRFFKTRGAA